MELKVAAPVSVDVPATAKLPVATLSADWPALPVIDTRSPPVWSTLFVTTIALVVACAGLMATEVTPVTAPVVNETDSTWTLPLPEVIVSDVDPVCVIVAVLCEITTAACADNVKRPEPVIAAAVKAPVSVDVPATAKLPVATLSADWPAVPVIDTRSPLVWATPFVTTIALVVACAGLMAIDLTPVTAPEFVDVVPSVIVPPVIAPLAVRAETPVMAPAVNETDSTMTIPLPDMIVNDVEPVCVIVAVACEMI